MYEKTLHDCILGTICVPHPYMGYAKRVGHEPIHCQLQACKISNSEQITKQGRAVAQSTIRSPHTPSITDSTGLGVCPGTVLDHT